MLALVPFRRSGRVHHPIGAQKRATAAVWAPRNTMELSCRRCNSQMELRCPPQCTLPQMALQSLWLPTPQSQIRSTPPTLVIWSMETLAWSMKPLEETESEFWRERSFYNFHWPVDFFTLFPRLAYISKASQIPMPEGLGEMYYVKGYFTTELGYKNKCKFYFYSKEDHSQVLEPRCYWLSPSNEP